MLEGLLFPNKTEITVKKRTFQMHCAFEKNNDFRQLTLSIPSKAAVIYLLVCTISNLTDKLSIPQVAEKQCHSIAKIKMEVCKETGSVPSSPWFDSGKTCTKIFCQSLPVDCGELFSDDVFGHFSLSHCKICDF